MILRVDCAALTLTVDGVATPCLIGRTGPIDAAAKREGDGHTPRGRFAVREILLRPDRGLGALRHDDVRPNRAFGSTEDRHALATVLPWRWLAPADGWSDDPADPAYNTAVTHPHAFSAEHLWRDDGLYDIVVPLGYNDAPPVAGRGSAIFLHCTAPGHPATAGCVAIDREALAALLPFLTSDDWIEIA